MDLFYLKSLTSATTECILEGEEAQHISKVLRKKVGDLLLLTNGKGLEWQGQIAAIFSKKVQLKCTYQKEHPPLPYSLHIAIAPTKSNDRIEWFLEKATEIGLTKITPLLCDHSERKIIKHERWNKILGSAMKQSQRFYLPDLQPLTAFKDFLEQEKNNELLVAHCKPGNKTALNSIARKKEYTVLIGPEGDFSEKEIEQITARTKAIEIDLGPARYRTETAGIVACLTIALKEM